MTDDLTALRELAEKAVGQHRGPGGTIPASLFQFENTFGPECVLALLDRLERAEAKAKSEAEKNRMRRPSAKAWESIVERAERAETATERVRALHKTSSNYVPSFVDMKLVCDACGIAWPCPTARALVDVNQP